MATNGPNRDARTNALSVDISDFGPISGGRIRLSPLTILMGPHNSGKSYAATLIYSFLSAHAAARSESWHSIPWRRIPARLDCSDSLLSNVKKLIQKNSFAISAAQSNRLMNDVFAPMLKDAIEHGFGAPTRDLIRFKKKTSKITVTGSDVYEIKIADDLKISARFNDSTAHKVRIVKGAQDLAGSEDEGGTLVLYVDKTLRTEAPRLAVMDMIRLVLGSLRPQFNHPHYLPAARSGILQGHRALAASFVQRATRAGIDRLETPRLTKAASEFISDLIDMPDRPGPFATLSEDLGRCLLGGSIGLSQPNKHHAPDIVYKLPNGDVPLHRSSSTVSEMAPLSLYLKHIVKKGDLLIIEEPEAHLHLSNQIEFAKYVARMIRQGLNLLITTHSFVLMEALNNYVVASGMDRKSKIKAGIDEGDYLLPEEVSPHLCRKDGNGGHAITPIEMDEYGISLQEFREITERFYERGLEVDKWVERNGS